ncbi:MAG: M23 family metallopeptidase [Bacteroidales bacterium]|nr:M23 family metallopeptidase [Bacteroidales bacterium]
MTLVEDESHRRIRSYKFAAWKLLLLSVGVCILLAGGMYALVAFTPLRGTIPGYPDARSRGEALANAIRIDSLEGSIARWKRYTEHLRAVLSGQAVIEADSLMKKGTAAYLGEKTPAQLAETDSLLRDVVRREGRFGVGSEQMGSLPIEGMHFFCPLKGVISRGYESVLHPYLDISAPASSVVKAVLDGTVVLTEWSEEYGYSMVVQHDGNIISVYRHNERLLKRSGEKVKAGESVSLVGSASSALKGDHLHFEMWHKGQAVDPAKYISF